MTNAPSVGSGRHQDRQQHYPGRSSLRLSRVDFQGKRSDLRRRGASEASIQRTATASRAAAGAATPVPALALLPEDTGDCEGEAVIVPDRAGVANRLDAGCESCGIAAILPLPAPQIASGDSSGPPPAAGIIASA